MLCNLFLDQLILFVTSHFIILKHFENIFCKLGFDIKNEKFHSFNFSKTWVVEYVC